MKRYAQAVSQHCGDPTSEDENITVSAGGRAPIEVSALPQQWSFGRLLTGHLAKGGFFLRELLPDQQAILVAQIGLQQFLHISMFV